MEMTYDCSPTITLGPCSGFDILLIHMLDQFELSGRSESSGSLTSQSTKLHTTTPHILISRNPGSGEK